LLDFSHGQKKDIAQKEKYWQEKNKPEKVISEENSFRQEKDDKKSCAEKTCRKKEAGCKEEIISKKETGAEESHASPR
jgi:hypothetical protein